MTDERITMPEAARRFALTPSEVAQLRWKLRRAVYGTQGRRKLYRAVEIEYVLARMRVTRRDAA